MTTMPFGSTRRWYSSFGGRTAACSGTYQIATAAARSTRNRIESRLIFLFVIRYSLFVIFFKRLEPFFERAQLPAHVRQLAKHRRRAPPFTVGDRRIAGD